MSDSPLLHCYITITSLLHPDVTVKSGNYPGSIGKYSSLINNIIYIVSNYHTKKVCSVRKIFSHLATGENIFLPTVFFRFCVSERYNIKKPHTNDLLIKRSDLSHYHITHTLCDSEEKCDSDKPFSFNLMQVST